MAVASSHLAMFARSKVQVVVSPAATVHFCVSDWYQPQLSVAFVCKTSMYVIALVPELMTSKVTLVTPVRS